MGVEAGSVVDSRGGNNMGRRRASRRWEAVQRATDEKLTAFLEVELQLCGQHLIAA